MWAGLRGGVGGAVLLHVVFVLHWAFLLLSLSKSDFLRVEG